MSEKNPLIITPAEESDISRLAEISLESYLTRRIKIDYSATEWIESKTRDLMEGFIANETTIIKISDETEILGYLAFCDYIPPRNRENYNCKALSISDLYTIPNDKRPGSKLLEFFLDKAKNEQIEKVFLFSTDHSLSFYKRYPFHELEQDNTVLELLLSDYKPV